jgi:hypothetical protein
LEAVSDGRLQVVSGAKFAAPTQFSYKPAVEIRTTRLTCDKMFAYRSFGTGFARRAFGLE